MRIAADISENDAAAELARRHLAASTGIDALVDQISTQRLKVEDDRATAAETRAAHEGMAREAALRATRLGNIEKERRDWTQRIANAESQIATLKTRQSESVAERETLAGEPEKIATKRSSLLSEIVVADAKRAETADRLAVGEKAASEADKAARVALDRHAEARELRGRSEERMTAARQRLTESEERIREALDCAPEEAAGIAELDLNGPLPDLTEIETRLERHKQERERLGAVNLRADEEAREIGARRDTLVNERTDLVEAIARLRQGIGSLNREGRERLSAAFETVNAHFKRLFTHLFGGGTAELQLTESDDPLEAGLEIVARPPGCSPAASRR
jgi:chromosome segregation protein